MSQRGITLAEAMLALSEAEQKLADLRAMGDDVDWILLRQRLAVEHIITARALLRETV